MSKILFIEDDVFFGDMLTEKLRAGGYEVLFSRDSASALSLARDARPNLVLTDVASPNLGGFEILGSLQGNASLKHIPVIAILNGNEPAEVDRVLALGARDYLTKTGFDPEEALEKVKLQLSGKDIGLPPKTPLAAAAKQEPARSVELIGKKIMWVEDDKFLSDIITRKLSTHQCVLFHATEGESALKILEKEHPDLVLLDILLSGMDGFEILKRIKSSAKTRQTPVILLSNLGQKEDIEKGKSLGAARFLIKATVTLDEIIAEIGEVLKETNRT